MRLVEKAQEFIAAGLLNGDYAIDATVGNGHDIIFLAKLVGEDGHVYGFDVQKRAIKRSAQILKENKLYERTTLLNTGHENILSSLPSKLIGHCKAIMFNLGYLPCSDKSIVTLASTTLIALDSGLNCLAPGAKMAITIYKAHDGGTNEYNAINQWLKGLDSKKYQSEKETDLNNPLAPELICLTKLQNTSDFDQNI